MKKTFWIVLGLLAVVFLGFLIWNNGSQGAIANSRSALVIHATGKQDAAVTLIEYSDFQCPACGAYYPTVEKIIQKYQDRIRFEYRHYPLITIHQHAFGAGRAAEAASQQGKFWEMYRLLFDNQAGWSSSSRAQTIFEGYARQLQLDAEQFKLDFRSSRTNSAINASIAEFNARGLRRATPTFLLNDKKIEPANTVNDFSRLIDEQLKLTGEKEL